MVDHICEPMPSTGSHLPNYAARWKMGERHRLQLSKPWGQRTAYAPQKGIEVDALGALSAAHIGINMVKPG
jgi:hypothetical protein